MWENKPSLDSLLCQQHFCQKNYHSRLMHVETIVSDISVVFFGDAVFVIKIRCGVGVRYEGSFTAHEVNWTELKFANSHTQTEVHCEQAHWNTCVENWLSTNRPRFAGANQYKEYSWRWRAWSMNASCNWVDFFRSAQVSSVQFMHCDVVETNL